MRKGLPNFWSPADVFVLWLDLFFSLYLFVLVAEKEMRPLVLSVEIKKRLSSETGWALSEMRALPQFLTLFLKTKKLESYLLFCFVF